MNPNRWYTLGRTLCEVCGISVLKARMFEYGPNRCRLHRKELGPAALHPANRDRSPESNVAAGPL